MRAESREVRRLATLISNWKFGRAGVQVSATHPLESVNVSTGKRGDLQALSFRNPSYTKANEPSQAPIRSDIARFEVVGRRSPLKLEHVSSQNHSTRFRYDRY